MACKECGKPQCNCGKDHCSPAAAIQINNPAETVLFRKVIIPASAGDETTNPPVPGAFCNALVYYEATKASYLYSSDGIPTRIDGTGEAKAIWDAIDAEAETRSHADQEIWTEIETIEASSDVVDVVGTYADLQAYDTSKLHANDLIKVLQDETKDDAITYYRWSGTAFNYVGAEGPYYTASETDTLLAGKQNTLTAGAGIEINNDVISATGTASNTIFYMNASETGYTRHLYETSDMTDAVTIQDIIDANDKGQVIVRITTSAAPSVYSDMYLQNAYVASGDYQMIFLDSQYYYGFYAPQTSDNIFQFTKSEVQHKLTAGTNIQINGNTISATDTTYSNFVGATSSVAGSSGLVPAPTTSDPDKFLKGDGTWGTPPTGPTYTAGTGINITNGAISVDNTVIQEKLVAGANISIGTVSSVPNTISVTGMPVLYSTQGQNVDGAVTQKLFTDTVGDVEAILQRLNSGNGV